MLPVFSGGMPNKKAQMLWKHSKWAGNLYYLLSEKNTDINN